MKTTTKKEGNKTMTQKELKQGYAEELKKAWSSEKMVKYCLTHTAYIVEHNGFLYGIEKPSIETSFCFGYGMYGITDSEEEEAADSMTDKARQSRDFFISENLKDIDHWLETLEGILSEMGENWAEGSHPRYMIETGRHYCGQPDDCKLQYYRVVNTWRDPVRGTLCNDPEMVCKLIDGYEAVKVDFVKRLNAYLNRYGLSKVKSWSYLRD